MKQSPFASLAFDRKRKQTRQARLMGQMGRRHRCLVAIEPHYSTTGSGISA